MIGIDETTRAIIDRITVHYDQPTRIPAGYMCRVFYDCSHLSPNDLARLAAQATGHLTEGSFDLAIGLAYSGVFFAAAVAGGRQVGIVQIDGGIYGPSPAGKKVLLVDDVVFSGSRLTQAARAVEENGGRVVGYACVVDRSEGQLKSALGRPLWSAYEAGLD